jgi:hypothetical protein
MSALASFLESLFREGNAVLRERPVLPTAACPDALRLLSHTFADYRLDLAGPLVPFDPAVALAAADLLWQACWFLVNHSEPDAAVERRLIMPGPPATAAQHLSADLVLRYLPQVQRRARAIAADDVLALRLAAVLRQWPLSGVLSDIQDEPTTPLNFDGHYGLQLLYAERLAHQPKPAWVPGAPATREVIELVFAGLGRTVPAAAESKT